MNVRDVLMHMTGLPGGLFPGNPIDDAFAEARQAQTKGLTLEGITALLAEHPLKFHPGTHWNYGLSTDIVGRLVEITVGRALRRLPAPGDLRAARHGRHRLLRPRGRRRSGSPRSTSSSRRNTPALVEDPTESPYLRRRSYLSGAGGLVSTTQRLRRLLPDAAQRGPTRRPADPRAQDPRAHDEQPPPRRGHADRPGRRRVRRGRVRRRRVRPGLRRRARARSPRPWPARRATSTGAARPAPPSGSIRPRTSSPSS